MAIYRADPKHGVCWITGGSTGIGRQVALDLARDGWTVAVTSRKEDPIEPVIEAVEPVEPIPTPARRSPRSTPRAYRDLDAIPDDFD